MSYNDFIQLKKEVEILEERSEKIKTEMSEKFSKWHKFFSLRNTLLELAQNDNISYDQKIKVFLDKIEEIKNITGVNNNG